MKIVFLLFMLLVLGCTTKEEKYQWKLYKEISFNKDNVKMRLLKKNKEIESKIEVFIGEKMYEIQIPSENDSNYAYTSKKRNIENYRIESTFLDVSQELAKSQNELKYNIVSIIFKQLLDCEQLNSEYAYDWNTSYLECNPIKQKELNESTKEVIDSLNRSNFYLSFIDNKMDFIYMLELDTNRLPMSHYDYKIFAFKTTCCSRKDNPYKRISM